MKQKLAMGAALAGAAVLGALAVAYVNAQPGKAPAGAPVEAQQSGPAPAPAKATTGQFSVQQETAIREIVRQYLIAHPEVLADAARAYDVKQDEQRAAAAQDGVRKNLAELLSDADGARAGKDVSKAKVAVIELMDYHCSYCKHAAPIVRSLTTSDEKVKVVFRELPILRKESEFAAKAALAARAQGKYTDFHFAMMEATGLLTKERVLDLAKKAGLDPARLERDAAAPQVAKALSETQRIARELMVDGTPAFVVTTTDGSFVRMIPGFREDELRDAIAAAKKAAG